MKRKNILFSIGPEEKKMRYTCSAPDNNTLNKILPKTESLRGIYIEELKDEEIPEEIDTLSVCLPKRGRGKKKTEDVVFSNFGRYTKTKIKSSEGLLDCLKNSERNINSIILRVAMISLARDFVFIHGSAFKHKEKFYILHNSQKGTGKSLMLKKMIEGYDVEPLADSYIPVKVKEGCLEVYPQSYPKKRIGLSSGRKIEKIDSIDKVAELNSKELVLVNLIYSNQETPTLNKDDDATTSVRNSAESGLNLNFLQRFPENSKSKGFNTTNFNKELENYLTGLNYRWRVEKITSKFMEDALTYRGTEKDFGEILNLKS